MPGQLPLVDALLNSHPDNKRRHGRVSPVRVETWPKCNFILQRLSLFCVCCAALTVHVVVFACAHLSFQSFKWFNAHLREGKTEMRGRKMKIRIINPTYLLSRSNQLTEPERAFRLQNLMSRDFLRGVGRKKIALIKDSAKPVTRSDVINSKVLMAFYQIWVLRNPFMNHIRVCGSALTGGKCYK